MNTNKNTSKPRTGGKPIRYKQYRDSLNRIAGRKSATES